MTKQTVSATPSCQDNLARGGEEISRNAPARTRQAQQRAALHSAIARERAGLGKLKGKPSARTVPSLPRLRFMDGGEP